MTDYTALECLTLAHTVPLCAKTVPCPTHGCPCPTCATLAPSNPFSEMLCEETREIRQLNAELDEWCAKVRRLDVPLPLYSDEELALACVPLDRWRWDLAERGITASEVGVYPSDRRIPRECKRP